MQAYVAKSYDFTTVRNIILFTYIGLKSYKTEQENSRKVMITTFSQK